MFKYMALTLVILTGCAATMALGLREASTSCNATCAAAAKEQEAGYAPGPDSFTYDPYDDTCTCTFRDGRMFTTKRNP